MALGRFITYFLSSLTLFFLLLLLLPPNHECSKLTADAAYHINVNEGNSNAIGTSPFLCKTASNVSSSRGTLTFSRKPAVSLALYGFVSSGLFWMLFAYFWQKSVINENASSIAASSCIEMEEDDFNDEYGIMSRRRIRTQNKRVVSNDE